MFFSIRHKITLTYALLFVLIFLVLGTWLSGVLARQYEQNLETNLLNNARLVAGFINQVDAESLKGYVDKVGEELEVRVTVIDAQGLPLAETDRTLGELDNHLDRPEVQKALIGDVGVARRFSSTLNANMLYVAAPIPGDDGITGVMRLSRSLTDIKAATRNIRLVIFGAMIAGLGFSGLFGWLLARAITRSVETLIRKARDFGKGSFSNHKEVRSRDEIGELELVFNDMADSILTNMASQDRERSRVEKILRYLPVGVLVIDGNGLLVAANNAAREILGSSPGGEKQPLTHLTRNWQVNEFVNTLLVNREDSQQEIILSGGNGRQFIRLRGAAVVKAGAGEQGEVVVVLQDVTDLRLMEQQRKDLVANVSHELRTPLTAIQGFAETLLEEDMDTETSRHFIGIIRQESVRLSRLLNDLLNLSRLEGKARRKQGTSNLREVATGVVKVMSEMAKARGKELNAEIGDEIVVDVEQDYVEQILTNFIDNALKFTPEGTRVRVVSEVQDNGFVRLAVLDTGPGISPEEQKRLFERFFRIDKARGRDAGGTGLGLAIVKHIVEGFGGQVGVVSHPGSGTSFWATLPIKKSTNK